MSKNNSLSDDFTQGSIVGKLVKFMIPVLGALILQAMYGAVDLLVVGQFGTDAGISAVATGHGRDGFDQPVSGREAE